MSWIAVPLAPYVGTARSSQLASTALCAMWIGPDYIDGAALFAHDHPGHYDGYHPKRDA